MASGIFDIECPCCRAKIRVDAGTGAVLYHEEHQKPPAIEDLAVAAANLKGEAARREEIFQKSFAEQKNRQSVMDKRFDELFKKAKEEPDEKPPRRPFDLD
jgi:hypothetical protein